MNRLWSTMVVGGAGLGAVAALPASRSTGAKEHGSNALQLQAVGESRGSQDLRRLLSQKGEVGSVTKPIVAILATYAVRDGKIRWDTPVGEVFREVTGAAGTVTFRELLEHTSGFKNEAFPVEERDIKASDHGPYTALMFASAWTAEDRGKFCYSNYNYSVAWGMLASVHGERSFGRLMGELSERTGTTLEGIPSKRLCEIGCSGVIADASTIEQFFTGALRELSTSELTHLRAPIAGTSNTLLGELLQSPTNGSYILHRGLTGNFGNRAGSSAISVAEFDSLGDFKDVFAAVLPDDNLFGSTTANLRDHLAIFLCGMPRAGEGAKSSAVPTDPEWVFLDGDERIAIPLSPALAKRLSAGVQPAADGDQPIDIAQKLVAPFRTVGDSMSGWRFRDQTNDVVVVVVADRSKQLLSLFVWEHDQFESPAEAPSPVVQAIGRSYADPEVLSVLREVAGRWIVSADGSLVVTNPQSGHLLPIWMRR